MKFPLTPNIQPAMCTCSFSKQYESPKLMLSVVRWGCFWWSHVHEKLLGCYCLPLHHLWSPIQRQFWGNQWTAEGSLAAAPCTPLGHCWRDAGACSSLWSWTGWADRLRAVVWMVWGEHAESTLLTALCHCSAPLACSLTSSRVWTWLCLEERLLGEHFPEQTGCSQGSPCGVAGVGRERSLSLPTDFPASSLQAPSQLLAWFPSLPSRP